MSGKSQGIWRWMISVNPGMNYFMLKFVISDKGGLNIQQSIQFQKGGMGILKEIRYCILK